MKKICFYALCTLLSVGCKVSHQSSENKNRKKEKTTIDSLAPNPFIRHMYTADPSARVWDDGRLYVYASAFSSSALHRSSARRKDVT